MISSELPELLAVCDRYSCCTGQATPKFPQRRHRNP
jgi:ABC-type sugar transport system ATPase subunit